MGAWKGAFGADCDRHYEGTSGQNQYLSKVIDALGGPVKSADDVGTGVEAYRAALADPRVPNASVAVASIGLPTNLRDLLDSPADKISPLTGKQLVAAKVKQIVFMDGGYNFGCTAGNIGPCGDARCDCWGAAQVTLEDMPASVSMVFSGAGADPDIYTGAGLQASHPPNSPCRKAYSEWCCNPNGKDGKSGRLSWDPIAVMIASLGVGSVYEKLTAYGTQVSADADGREHFFGGGTRNARTAFNGTSDPTGHISRAIDHFLNTPPGGTPSPSPPPGGAWQDLPGHNCWGDRGTGRSHGAKDLESPAAAPAPGSPMPLADCKSACEKLDGCTGVTVGAAGAGLVNCYRKGDLVPGQCDKGTQFDTYLKPGVGWAKLAGKNCWGDRGTGSSHGATDLENPASAAAPGSPMSLAQCESACEEMPGCSAVTVGDAGGGKVNCFRKADVVAQACDQGTMFDSYVML